MVLSLNCIILGDTTTFPIELGNQVIIGDMQYDVDEFRISNFKKFIWSEKKESKLSGINDPDYLVLWKVDVKKDKIEGIYTTEHIKNKLNGKKMEEENFIPNYFDVKQRPDTNIHIIVVHSIDLERKRKTVLDNLRKRPRTLPNVESLKVLVDKEIPEEIKLPLTQ
ncbi:3058_t:CDS:2, partial [Funneliformis geosporum]